MDTSITEKEFYELKPCPGCKSSDVCIIYFNKNEYIGDPRIYHFVRCQDCGISGKYARGRKECAQLWNNGEISDKKQMVLEPIDDKGIVEMFEECITKAVKQ